MTMLEISKLIQEKRKALDLSQEKLAKIAGVSRQAIMHLEGMDNGKARISTLLCTLAALKIEAKLIDSSN